METGRPHFDSLEQARTLAGIASSWSMLLAMAYEDSDMPQRQGEHTELSLLAPSVMVEALAGVEHCPWRAALPLARD